ncbi:MAG: hypothetical protein ACQERZ_04355 [Fusobacteriota bacterium]
MEYFYFVLGIILMVSIIYIQKLYKRHLWRKKKEHALEGEQKAKTFLQSQGYKVLNYQGELTYTLLSNGIPKKIKIRPDYIVKKGLKKYITEIKTGKKVIKAKNISTRRQLLEYYFSSSISGILLVDMENNEIKKIEFKNNKISKLQRKNSILKWIILILLSLLGVSIWQELVLYIIKIKKVIEIFFY